MLSKNLTFLRKKQKLSQKEIAECLGIRRTTWISYEKGKSEPSASTLKKISEFFKIKIDDMILKEISLAKETEVITKNQSLRVLAITVNNKGKENIEFVPIKAAAGYALNFSNPSFVKELPNFSIPKLSEGTYRAFEIQGNSMLPTKEGDVIIGKYIEQIHDIRNNKRYIIVLNGGNDILFKRVFMNTNQAILVSDNPEFSPFNIELAEISELWEMVACIKYGDEINNNQDFLLQKMNQIEQKINKLIDN